MTDTLDHTALHRAMGSAAALIAGRLPLAFQPSEANDRPEALLAPGEGSLALAAGLSGVDGSSILLALPPTAIAPLTEGPLGAQDLSAALAPLVTDAIAPLASVFGEGCALEAPHVLPADLAIESVLASGAHTVTVTLRSADAGNGVLVVALRAPDLDLQQLGEGGPSAPRGDDSSGQPLELLGDVEMAVTAVLGRTRLTVRHLLGLRAGYVVELDKTADSAVDLLVNGTLVARGEVVVIDDEFGVRITEIVSRQGRG